MADEKPKKLSLKEIAERAAKTQPQVSPGAPTRVTYAPGDPVGSQPPTSRPPTSQPPLSSPPGSVPPGSVPPRPSGAPSTPPGSVPPPSASAKKAEEPKADAAKKETAKDAPKKAADAKKPEEKKDEPASPLPFLVGGIVLVSIAALAYAMIKRPQGGPSATPLTTASVVASTAAPSVSAAPSASAAPATGDLDINALGAVPSADPGKHGGPLPKDPKDKDKTAGAGGDKKPDTPPAATSAVALGPAGELSDEIKKRMGGGGGGKAEGEGPSGPSPDAKEAHPSPGAVAGALNAVRGAARACLADTEDVARVNIVFGSSGSAQSVSVTGTKAEGCVKGAMMKAKVAPFTDPTFSTSVTIRP